MCGIVGYIGEKQAQPILVAGLKRLEYRGYDSAGIATMSPKAKVTLLRAKGKVSGLDEKVTTHTTTDTVGVGHTRWATHGAPSDVNSHPQVSEGGRFAVVHNGIIENFRALKDELLSQGVSFRSDTDTEVTVQLLARQFRDGDTAGDLLDRLATAGARLLVATLDGLADGTVVAVDPAEGSPFVSADTVTDQVGHQLEQALGALLSRREFSDAVNDTVARIAHEVLEKHLVARSLPDDAGPIDFLNRRQFAECSE